MSASSSNKKKKMTEVSVDRLSALPDSILCSILSLLETRDAAITSLLSKRWQFLWTQSPVLRFRQVYVKKLKEITKFVSRVNRTLVICRRDNLERFEVNFTSNYDRCFAVDVNAWIGFAVENRVKAFSLLVSGSHPLPGVTYSNPSWTSLTVGGCVMAPGGAIRWQSLTTLRIERVQLDENTFGKIFSGCPVLRSLEVVGCRGFSRLEVKCSSLRSLALEEDREEDEEGGNGDDLQISAPYLHSLKIVARGDCRLVRLENIKSLTEAEVVTDSDKCLKQLLGCFRYVKMLKLGPGCIQLLTPSWKTPLSTRKCLELHVKPCYEGRTITGIVAMLDSSPKLETLIIHGDDTSWVHLPSNPTLKDDLDRDLFHLKTVRFKKFRDLTYGVRECTMLASLAQILLKRAIGLENMVVDLSRSNEPQWMSVFDQITQKLLIYSKFSQKTVVLFSKELSSSVNGRLSWP